MRLRVLKLTVLFIFMTGLTTLALANNKFQCLINLTKDPKWNQENVVINLVDFSTKQIIQTVNLNAATNTTPSVNSVIQPFDCTTYPVILLQATYTPSIWSTDKGKVYNSKDAYDLTSQIAAAEKQGIEKLEVTLNFPADFPDVPSLVD